MVDLKFDARVDASGLLCPLPLLKSKRQLNRMQNGEILLLVATDSNAEEDMRKFCDQSSNELLQVERLDDAQHLYLRKG